MPTLRRCLLLLTWSVCATVQAADAERSTELRIQDETQMPAPQLRALTQEFSRWTRRVNAYLQVKRSQPVEVVFTRRTAVGLYLEGRMYLPVDDPSEMLETFIHELAHHVTGHDSSYFFKEGIASHTLEALYRQQGKLPQGWPQYGVSNDAWIRLFQRNGQLLSLQEALDWPQYDGHSAEADYRSWQVYLMGGSFVGWYNARYGYPAFKDVFDQEQLPAPTATLEKQWLAAIAQRKLTSFDPADQLPEGARYQRFAKRLPLH